MLTVPVGRLCKGAVAQRYKYLARVLYLRIVARKSVEAVIHEYAGVVLLTVTLRERYDAVVIFHKGGKVIYIGGAVSAYIEEVFTGHKRVDGSDIIAALVLIVKTGFTIALQPVECFK